jgi:hypothetical protein
MEEDIVKIIKKNMSNAFGETMKAFIIVIVPLLLFALMAAGLLFSSIQSNYSAGVALLVSVAFVVAFMIIVALTFVSNVRYFDRENARYKEALNDTQLIDEWNASRTAVLSEDKTGTAIFKTPSYLCVIEDLTQGPFFIRFTDINVVTIEFRRTKRHIEIVCEIKPVESKKSLYCLLYFAGKVQDFSDTELYAVVKYLYGLSIKHTIKTSKDCAKIARLFN